MRKILSKSKLLKKVYNYLRLLFFDIKAMKKFKGIRNIAKENSNLCVVFITQYIPSWKKLEPIYRGLLEHKNVKPIIFCVPSNIENSCLINSDLGQSYNDTYEIFKKEGYDAINALSDNGEWVDLKALKPSCVFYTRPYNPFMPVEYSSDEVSKYTKVCVMLYAMILTKKDMQVELNDYFFRDVYCYFAENSEAAEFVKKHYWLTYKKNLRKVCNYGSPVYEEILKSKDIKNSVWDFAGTRYKVMWTPRWTIDKTLGGTNFFEYKDVILDYAKKHNDVAILIRPHPLMFNNFIKIGKMSVEEVEDYKNRVEELENVKLDTEQEYIATFWESDMLLTDFSSIITEYLITDKPIVYCDTNSEFELVGTGQAFIDACYKVYSKDEVVYYLEHLKDGKDELYKKRIETKKNIFGDSLNICTDMIINEIMSW